MVIIKTKDGVQFVNEAECLQVIHNRVESRVEVWPNCWMTSRPVEGRTFYVIDDVVWVKYVSAGRDFLFDSAEDELRSLRVLLESEKRWRRTFCDVCVMYGNFISIVLERITDDAIYEKVSKEWKRLRKKADEMIEEAKKKNEEAK